MKSQLALDFAFNCLNMPSVSLWIPENETMKIKGYKNSGFKEMARRGESNYGFKRIIYF